MLLSWRAAQSGCGLEVPLKWRTQRNILAPGIQTERLDMIGTFRIFATRFYCPGQCSEEFMLVSFLWQCRKVSLRSLENAVWSNESRINKDIKKASSFSYTAISGLNECSATPMQLLACSRWFLLYALFHHPHPAQYLKWRWGYLSSVVLLSSVIFFWRWNEYLF